jgi:hypothetical protein
MNLEHNEIAMKRPRSMASRSWITVRSGGVPIRYRPGQLELAEVAENAQELQRIAL